MKWVCTLLLVMAAAVAPAKSLPSAQTELLCHRTANEDVPENTLESLEQAALLGCNVVEIDLRRTLDGQIVLNHDGILERLTDGVGDVETSDFDELRMRDAGAWMGVRFAEFRIPLFEDALRLARKRDIRLILDIKTKGIGADVLALLRQEDMLDRVQFGGEWEDIRRLYPGASNGSDRKVWVQPGVTAEQVAAYHREGHTVVANFSANTHDMDLNGMKAAVAAGVDGINVDYPRLGADAVGRPAERTIHALTIKARTGDSSARAAAILELARYRGFPLQDEFAQWLLDPDDHVSRAAAVALVKARPQTPLSVFAEGLRSEHAGARANAAWALGELDAPASELLPLLNDNDPRILQATLVALGRAPGEVNTEVLLPLLAHGDPSVRGSASLALARHQPDAALKAIPAQLHLEMEAAIKLGDDYERRGRPQLSQTETNEIMGHFRCQMKMVQALSMIKGAKASRILEEIAFRPGQDSALYDSIVAAFQLWDRVGEDPLPAVQALGSSDTSVADRAEWMLIKGGTAVLPAVRDALKSESPTGRDRAIRIVAWQGDMESVATLRMIRSSDPDRAELIAWAIEKIQSLHSAL